MNIQITRSSELDACPVAAFAVQELKTFLEPCAAVTVAEAATVAAQPAARQLSLRLDTDLSDGAFTVRPEGAGIRLAGSDSAGVLHAVYTLLEALGYTFEITGPRAPSEIAEPAWSQVAETVVTPHVRRRGIRQHINFPMDISSYPLEEACEYLRNLARLRFNAISFHSYPGQWYEVPGDPSSPLASPRQGPEPQLAGGFFYGRTHAVPTEHPLFAQHVRNGKVFCIPEIEPVLDDRPARSRRAIEWLLAVLAEAKRVGLRVQFSFEPRDAGTDLTRTLATVESILSDYPVVDALELITEEEGGWGEAPAVEEIRELVCTRFGERFLASPIVSDRFRPGQARILKVFGQLAHNIEAIRHLEEAWRGRSDRPQLASGVYCTAPDYLSAILELQRELLPDSVEFALLPGHSSGNTAKHMQTTTLLDEDWRRLTLYSWIEFDGMMYLQQNGLHGIRQALDYAESYPAGAPKAMLFNHWRTAENRTCARFAALATLTRQRDEPAFYRAYAASLGIADAEAYVSAMLDLDELDGRSRDLLPNFAFSYAPCWGKPGDALGSFYGWRPERIRFFCKQHEAIRSALQRCSADTTSADGRSYLAFLVNRLDASIVYCQAMARIAGLAPICRWKREPGDLSPDERQTVLQACNAALADCERYMEIHCAAMPDRGCEGTLVDFYGTLPAQIKRIRFEYTGVPVEDVTVRHDGADAPHVPL